MDLSAYTLAPVCPGPAGTAEVVGIGQRRPAFDRLVASLGRKCEERTSYGGTVGRATVTAVLVPQAVNDRGKPGVLVTVGGEVVGHLDAANAMPYFETLQPLADSGRMASVDARIRWMTGGQYDADTITLDLPRASLMFPANEAPPSPWRFVSHARNLKVPGDADRDAVVRDFLAGRYEANVHGVLSESVLEGARSSKAVTRISLDGRQIGTLSPTVSAHVLPELREAAASGTTLVTVTRIVAGSDGVEVLCRLPLAPADSAKPEHKPEARPAAAATPPAAWYPDPENPALYRYWDGSAWTDHRAPR